MTTKDLQASVRLKGALAVLAAAAVLAAPSASAQQPPSMGFSNSMTSRPAPSGATKYEDTAQRSFIVQRAGNQTLMKFDDNPEVFVLNTTTAQRGDDFMRTDSGRLILKLTEQGNMVAYFANTAGAPADPVGVASPFNAPPVPASLGARQKETQQRLSKIVGHEVTMFGQGEFASESAWASDAMMVMLIGVERALKDSPDSVKALRAARLTHTQGAMVSYSASDGELVIGLNPKLGYAGRPSSEAIAQAMMIR